MPLFVWAHILCDLLNIYMGALARCVCEKSVDWSVVLIMYIIIMLL